MEQVAGERANKAAEYLKAPYARILIPNEEGGFTAEVLEFPGCIAEGETADEAIRNLERVAKTWIETSLNQGKEIPLPCSDYDYSGRIALRLPRSLHRQAARMAEREGTSLNQYLVTAVALLTGASDMYNRIAQRLQSPNVPFFANVSVTVVNSEWVKAPTHALPVSDLHANSMASTSITGVTSGMVTTIQSRTNRRRMRTGQRFRISGGRNG